MIKKIVPRTSIFLAAAVLFAAIGYWLAGWGGASHDEPAEQAESETTGPGDTGHGPDHDDTANIVQISSAAASNLRMVTKTMQPESYTAPLTIPGEVIEIPGRSSLAVSSPIGGAIREIFVDAGQLIDANAKLFRLEIIDEPVLSAQVALLDVLGQEDVTETEFKRLEPLAKSGTIAGKMSLDMDYELRKLRSRKNARMQELLARGLNEEQVADIVDNRNLVKSIEINVGDVLQSARRQGTSLPEKLVVEEIEIHPGIVVSRGASLAHLADHRQLYVRGEAFEQDVPQLYELSEANALVDVQFGHSHEDASERHFQTRKAPLIFVDNHADSTTGIFHFYVRLDNEIVTDSKLANGTQSRQWRFKPGQRVHLRLPLNEFTDAFVLPYEAVVEEGIETFVFRQLFGHNEPGILEFEKIAVEVLYQDQNVIIIPRSGPVRVGDTLVTNQAFQLYLELLTRSGGSSGNAHHGHSH